MKVDDKVEILVGRFAGKHCYIEGFSDDGRVIICAKGWVISQKYDRAELKFIKRGESDANG